MPQKMALFVKEYQIQQKQQFLLKADPKAASRGR